MSPNDVQELKKQVAEEIKLLDQCMLQLSKKAKPLREWRSWLMELKHLEGKLRVLAEKAEYRAQGDLLDQCLRRYAGSPGAMPWRRSAVGPAEAKGFANVLLLRHRARYCCMQNQGQPTAAPTTVRAAATPCAVVVVGYNTLTSALQHRGTLPDQLQQLLGSKTPKNATVAEFRRRAR